MKKTILRKTIAGACILLFLTGCGSTTAQTTTQTTSESGEEFGRRVVSLLNNGKTEELFDLWEDDSKTSLETYGAVVPEKKTEGITWEYDEGDFGDQEGTFKLHYYSAPGDGLNRFIYEVKKTDGKWRLLSKPFEEFVSCDTTNGSLMIDDFESNVRNSRPDVGSCEDGTEPRILLTVAGEHEFTYPRYKGIFEQPIKILLDSTSEPKEYAMDSLSSNLSNVLYTLTPAEGYGEAVKKALVEEANKTNEWVTQCEQESKTGQCMAWRFTFGDDLTVTPTDDPGKPTLSGTVHASSNSSYLSDSATFDASELSLNLEINDFGVLSAAFRCSNDSHGYYMKSVSAMS